MLVAPIAEDLGTEIRIVPRRRRGQRSSSARRRWR